MKIRYIKNGMDPAIRSIYILVLRDGWKIKNIGRDGEEFFVRAVESEKVGWFRSKITAQRDFILSPEERTVLVKGHGCSPQ